MVAPAPEEPRAGEDFREGLILAEHGAATGPVDEPLGEGNAANPNEGETLAVDVYPRCSG